MDDTSYRDGIKGMYGFADWAAKVVDFDGENCIDFLLDERDFLGFEFVRRSALPGLSYSYSDYFQSVEDPAVTLAVDIQTYASVGEAHEAMVNKLSLCMAPNMPRLEEKDIAAGDIGFGGFGEVESTVFFTRFNMFVHVYNVGEKDVSVKEFAEKVDAQLLAHHGRK